MSWQTNSGDWSDPNSWNPNEPLATDTAYIDNAATAQITQAGEVCDELYLGFGVGDSGAVEMSSGDLSADWEYLGSDGTGTFTQTGGTHTVANYIYVGESSTGDGTYDLSGTGQLSANMECIGQEGTGLFTQSGGTNTAASYLHLGTLASADGTYNLSGTGQLLVSSESIGYGGTGAFTQSGGTHTVTEGLTLATNPGSTGSYDLQGGLLDAATVQLNTNGTFTQTGGTLDADVFNQDGGTVNGTLQNQGRFNYNSGLFNGRLLNQGTVNLYADFTADNGMDNWTSVTIDMGRTVTLNGAGLENNGTLAMSGGTLGGDGPLTNNSLITGHGTIAGSGGFANNGMLAATDVLNLSNSGANSNYGEIELTAFRQLRLTGGNLTNHGMLNLNRAPVIGSAMLDNSSGGTISGPGTVLSTFANSAGLVLAEDGTTSIIENFGNAGLIRLTSNTSILTGGAMTNTGIVEGLGNVGNDIANSGVIEAIDGTLTLSGDVANASAGLLTVSAGNKIAATKGMATNAGSIHLDGGTYDNVAHAMTNTGLISGHGVFRAGGLSNEGTATFTGGPTTVNSDVTNEVSGQLNVAHDPALFAGDVTNWGTVKITDTIVTFAGTYTENGAYISDPSDNYFTDLVIGETGYLVGGAGDNWFVSEDFVNNSLQDTSWNTVAAALTLGGASLQEIRLAGDDLGAASLGYDDNFAWGTLTLDSGVSITLLDGNAQTGAALYVGAIDLASGLTQLDDVYSDYNIYYDPSLSENGYLGGQTYALNGNGSLIPVPEPTTVMLVVLGGLAMLFYRRPNS